MKGQKGSRSIALLILNHGARCGWVVKATPRPLYPAKEIRYPFCRRLGGPQGRCGRERNFLRLIQLESRTIQHVPSCCTNYAILAAKMYKSVTLQAWSGPEISRKLRFPDFVTTAQGGGKVVSLTHRPHLPTGNSPGTHFC